MSEQSISDRASNKPRKKTGSKPNAKNDRGKKRDHNRLRSFPKMLVPVELRHHITATSFERNYPFFLQAFVGVSVSMRRADIARSSEVVNAFIVRVVKEASDEVQTIQKKLAAQIKDANAQVQKTINQVTRNEAEVPNNAANMYVELYKAADEALDHVFCAQILDKLTFSEQADLQERIRQLLILPTSCYSRLRAKLDKRLKLIDQEGEEAKDVMIELLSQIIEEDPTRETS